MSDQIELEKLFAEHGCADFKWINTKDIVVAQWVRMKCMFGCADYGRNATCPPNTLSVEDCRKFFDEYKSAVIFRFEKAVKIPEERKVWAKNINNGLLQLERAVFLFGYPKAFQLFMDNCSACSACINSRALCKKPEFARPAPEAMAVDVFSTAKKCGFPISVLTDYTQAMNRYAILLIE